MEQTTQIQPPPLIVGVTGHRPEKFGGYQWNPMHAKIHGELRRMFLYLRPGYIITGMAQGVDQWSAEICVELGIPFIAAVPFVGQEMGWPSNSQAKYRNLLARAYSVYTVSPGGYANSKLFERNKWIVNNCQKLVAVWNGFADGGTAHCVSYAKTIGRETFFIDPLVQLILPGESAPMAPANPPVMTASPFLVSRHPIVGRGSVVIQRPDEPLMITQTALQIIERARSVSTPQQNQVQQLPPTRQRTDTESAPAPNPYRRIVDVD